MDPIQPVRDYYKKVMIALAGCLVAFLIAFSFIWHLQQTMNANQQYIDIVKQAVEAQKRAQQPTNP